MEQIQNITIAERGCGKRKPGGLYLVGDFSGHDHGWFPRSLVCDCGIQHIKESRNCQTLPPAVHFPEMDKDRYGFKDSKVPFSFSKEEEHLFITIGVQHYKTPGEYLQEARRQGFSRLISQVPHALEIGKTKVFLIHPRAFTFYEDKNGNRSHTQLQGYRPVYEPGIIAIFTPKELQYVTKGDESPAEIQSRINAGQTPVRVSYAPLDEIESNNEPGYHAEQSFVD